MVLASAMRLSALQGEVCPLGIGTSAFSMSLLQADRIEVLTYLIWLNNKDKISSATCKKVLGFAVSGALAFALFDHIFFGHMSPIYITEHR